VVAETPRFNNNALRIVATGWRLSGIYRIASGAPLTVTTSIDRQLSGTSNQRPNQLMLDAYGDGSLANFLNPKAFALPALSTLGNMSPFTVRGPNLWGLDIALSRVFAIRERQSLEVRGEAFNLTNSLHPGNPNTVLNQNTFGRILATAPGSAGDPRIMQFAMKYVF
jgi:hypothetical protein